MTITPEPGNDSLHTPIASQNAVTRKTLLYPILGGGVFIILLMVVTIYAAYQSLPGDTLYRLKTNGLEALVEATHVRSADKAAYQVTRMQHRLDEVKELTMQDTVSDAAIAALLENTQSHWNTLDLIASTSIDSAFPKTTLLTTVNEFASVALAIEELAENHPPLIVVGDAVEDIRQDAVRLYRDRARSFVATENPDTALNYLTEQLKQVETALLSSNLDEVSMRSAENYLDRVEPAVQEGDFAKALVSIAEAYRFISMATYTGSYATLEEPIASSTIETSSSSATTTVSTPALESTTTPQ